MSTCKLLFNELLLNLFQIVSIRRFRPPVAFNDFTNMEYLHKNNECCDGLPSVSAAKRKNEPSVWTKRNDNNNGVALIQTDCGSIG